MSALYQYLSADHDRIDTLLGEAARKSDEVDMDAYSQFRKDLLRHIGIEEKVILPAIAAFQNGKQADTAARLRLDHGALVALLVPSPTAAIVETIRSILRVHNPLEEQDDGLYHLIDKLAGDKADDLLDKIRDYPDVPMNPYNDRKGVLEVGRRAVERAGHKPLF